MPYIPPDLHDADPEDAVTAANVKAWLTSAAIWGREFFPEITAPSHLRRWSAALSEALSTPAVINLVGDGLVVGAGSDGNATPALPGNDSIYRVNGLAGQLRGLFGATYGMTGDGIWNVTDSRVSIGGGATTDVSAGPNHGAVKLNGAGQTATYSLPACTDFDIWLWDGGTGTITFTVDGGSATSIPAGSGATGTWSRISVTGQTYAAHSVVITGAAAATAYVAGVHPVIQTAGVRVNRMGRTGDTTANLVGQDSALNADSAGQTRQQTAYAKVGAPHIVIVGYGTNDYLGQNSTSSTLAQPGTTPTQYQANLQSFCNIATASGACVLIWTGVPAPTPPTPETYPRSAYVTAAKTVAQATDHVAAIDVAEITKDWATASALGMQTSASANPTRRGHGVLARILHDVLSQQVVFG